jgi:heat shock protein HslJ
MAISRSFQFLLPICCTLFTLTSPSIQLNQSIAEPSQPSINEPAKEEENQLENTSWKLVSWKGSAGRKKYPLSGSQITLNFSKGIVSGTTGCNSYAGKYQLVNKLLKNQVRTTRIFCSQDLIIQQSRFLQVLKSSTVVLAKGKQNLTLIPYIEETSQTEAGKTTKNNQVNVKLIFRSQPASS